MKIYLIGALRNLMIPEVAVKIRIAGFDVFDDWYAPGPETDDYWRNYEIQRGRSYKEALEGHHAKNVFAFDTFHINQSHAAVAIMPAGKSAHLEIGNICGQGKPVFVLDEGDPERYDIMAAFVYGRYSNTENIIEGIKSFTWPKLPVVPQVIFHDALWLAGLLEGEGSFCISGAVPRMCLQMTDKDVVDKAASILQSKTWKGKTTKGGKKVWACGRAGLSAIEWMRIIRPLLGERRQQQILYTVEKWLERKTYNEKDASWWRKMFHLKIKEF